MLDYRKSTVIGHFVEEFLEKIVIDKINKTLKIYLIIGEYTVDLSKYSKRINNGNYTTIMGIKYKHKQGYLQYKTDYNIQLLIAV